MNEALQEYSELMQIAHGGQPFTYGEAPALPETVKGHDPNERFGIGFSFDRTVDVPDIVPATTEAAKGRVRLYVIATGDPDKSDDQALYLYTRLSWTPTAGGEHVSWTRYWVTRHGAHMLAQQPETHFVPLDPTKDNVSNVADELTRQIFGQQRYRAEWKQEFPGLDGNVYGRVNPPNGPIGIPFQMQRPRYHAEVIGSFTGDLANLTSMLYPAALGEVKPEVFGKLREWVVAQPEVALV